MKCILVPYPPLDSYFDPRLNTSCFCMIYSQPGHKPEWAHTPGHANYEKKECGHQSFDVLPYVCNQLSSVIVSPAQLK